MKIIESNWDEFNSYPSVNFYYDHYFKKYNESLRLIIFEGYECLYPFIENVITIPRPKNIHTLAWFEREALIKKKISELGLTSISNRQCIDDLHPNVHLYEYLFSKYTKHFIEKKDVMFSPPTEDVVFVKTLFKTINKPIICINGRNLTKVTGYNRSFIPLIEFLIKNGVYVFNCTLSKPNLNYDPSSYCEPDIESYNRNAAFFTESNYVISIGNAGGIYTHMQMPMDLIILGGGGWIDNNQYGFGGESMLTARQKFIPHKTEVFSKYHTDSVDENTFKLILKTINTSRKV